MLFSVSLNVCSTFDVALRRSSPEPRGQLCNAVRRGLVVWSCHPECGHTWLLPVAFLFLLSRTTSALSRVGVGEHANTSSGEQWCTSVPQEGASHAMKKSAPTRPLPTNTSACRVQAGSAREAGPRARAAAARWTATGRAPLSWKIGSSHLQLKVLDWLRVHAQSSKQVAGRATCIDTNQLSSARTNLCESSASSSPAFFLVLPFAHVTLLEIGLTVRFCGSSLTGHKPHYSSSTNLFHQFSSSASGTCRHSYFIGYN